MEEPPEIKLCRHLSSTRIFVSTYIGHGIVHTTIFPNLRQSWVLGMELQ